MTAKKDSILTASGNTSRYSIPVSHLDFDYVKSCSDTKELEKIYITLKSGDEGYYPQLQQTCEDRLRELNPNSRILRTDNPVSTKGDLDHSEWQELDKDLKDWSSGMKYMEESIKPSQNAQADTSEDNLPPVRSGAITITSEGVKTSKPAAKKPVKPREYRDWDKIDVDKELEKIDTDDKPKSRSFVDGKEIKDILDHIDTTGLTEGEKLMKANREKDKGNEAFKAGDHKEAIVYYTRSISLQPTAASYNNRALAYLKVEDWMKALTDTDEVLKLEPENVKALLRQATARKGLKQFDKAKKDLEKVLDKEPNNKRAQDLLQEVEKDKKEKKSKGRRMVIEDVDETNDETETTPKISDHGDSTKEEIIVNGHAEPSEVKVETPQTLANGHVDQAGGDTETGSKDIWSEEDVNEQIPVTASEKGDTINKASEKGDTINKNDIKEESDVENTDSQSSETGTKDTKDREDNVNNTVDKTDVQIEQETEIETDQTAEKTDKESEAVVKTLTRPVFYQKPFPENCLKLREEGNNLFRNGQYGEAITNYAKLIGILENADDQTVNLSLIYSNRAACQLKTGDLAGTVKDCTRSLQLVPHSVKPLIRRAMAYEHLERPNLAYIDYRHVLLLDNRMDQAHLGTKRCQELLHQKHGPGWREKVQLPSVAWWEIPEIIDAEGKSTSQVVFNNPVPATPQICAAAQPNTEPKELSAAEKFEKFKAEGNEFVKKSQFSEAVTCYNKCMEAVPDQVAVYTNRALCYIKLNQPFEAEEDCTHALSLEKDNVKALFRRAQARKMLGKNREGIEDINQLLKIDPKNTAAKKEMEVLKKHWREELDKLKKDMPVSLKEERDRRTKGKEKSEPKQRKRMVIEEVESDDDTQGDSQKGATSKSKSATEKPKVEEISSSRQNKPQHKPTDKKDSKHSPSSPVKTGSEKEKQTDRKTSQSQSSSKDSKKSKKKSQIKETSTGLPNVQPSVPKLEKATPYEFISAWNALKKSESLQPYYDLLQQIPSKELSSVISNKLDGPMLNVMTRCVAEYYLPKGEIDGAYQLLKNLSVVSRFGTVSMFMTSDDHSRMKTVFEKLSSHKSDVYSKEDIQKLKKDYSVK